MAYNIGEKLKALRKKRDLTQEQLSERLGVSFQAISKWETNASLPDITMFPILANFYGVTTDELLGVDITKTNEKIEAYFAEADKLYKSWKLAEMVDLMRKACIEFPGNDRLRYHLAWSLGQAQYMIRTKKENLDEAIGIAEKILVDSTDTQMRLNTTSLLSYLYHWNGDDSKALYYADELPEISQTSGYLIGRLGLKKGEEGIQYAKALIGEYYRALQENVLVICDSNPAETRVSVSTEDKINMFKELLRMQEIVFGRELLCENFFAMQFCYNIAALYLELDKKDEALDYLEKAYGFAEKFESYDEHSAFSSAIQKGVVSDKRRTWSQGAFKDLKDELCGKRFCSKYAKLIGEPRYEQLVKMIANAV